MQIGNSPTFIRFGAGKEKPVKIPKRIEKKLAEIAKKYNADVEVAKQMYQSLKSLKTLKLPDKDILKIIEHDLDPNSPKPTTAALGEEGGDNWGPPKRTTQALHETGGGDTFQPKPRPLPPQDPGDVKRITQATHETGQF